MTTELTFVTHVSIAPIRSLHCTFVFCFSFHIWTLDFLQMGNKPTFQAIYNIIHISRLLNRKVCIQINAELCIAMAITCNMSMDNILIDKCFRLGAAQTYRRKSFEWLLFIVVVVVIIINFLLNECRWKKSKIEISSEHDALIYVPYTIWRFIRAAYIRLERVEKLVEKKSQSHCCKIKFTVK